MCAYNGRVHELRMRVCLNMYVDGYACVSGQGFWLVIFFYFSPVFCPIFMLADFSVRLYLFNPQSRKSKKGILS